MCENLRIVCVQQLPQACIFIVLCDEDILSAFLPSSPNEKVCLIHQCNVCVIFFLQKLPFAEGCELCTGVNYVLENTVV